jgi:hypothetical protein
MLAIGAGLLKTGVDLIAALPGCERLFFGRMAEPLPEDVRHQADALRLRYDLEA